MNGFGDALRTLRTTARLTQAAVAARAHVSAAHIASFETGRRTPTPELAGAVDRALDAGGLLQHLAEADRKGEDVRRRAFLAGVTTLGGLGVISPRELGEAVRVSLQAALGGEATVDDWQRIADEYGRGYMTVGAEQLRRRIAGDLLVLRQHVVDDEHPALRSAAARISMVYGMTEASAGDPLAAVRWYRTSRAAADASQDTPTRVWARGREAFTRAYEGTDPAVVIAAADDAVSLAGGVPSLGLLEAHLARSHAYARLGVQRPAIEALAHAQQVYSAVGGDETATVYAMPAWRMATACSLTLSRVGTPAQAEAMRVQAREALPDGLVRWGAHLQMHRAITLARQGDPASCTEALATLEQIAPEQRTLTLRLFAAEVLSTTGDRESDAARALLDLIGDMP